MSTQTVPTAAASARRVTTQTLQEMRAEGTPVATGTPVAGAYPTAGADSAAADAEGAGDDIEPARAEVASQPGEKKHLEGTGVWANSHTWSFVVSGQRSLSSR